MKQYKNWMIGIEIKIGFGSTAVDYFEWLIFDWIYLLIFILFYYYKIIALSKLYLQISFVRDNDWYLELGITIQTNSLRELLKKYVYIIWK